MVVQQNKSSPTSIRILLADDHFVVREGIALLLRHEPDLNFVGFAEDGARACEEFERLRPDVMLLDLRMPVRDGLDVARDLVKQFQARIIILTTFESEEDLIQSMKAGIKGYLLKESGREEIVDAIRTVAKGGSYLPVRLTKKVARFICRNELSPRELAVLHLMCAGKSNKEIGAALSITEATVKTHVKGIFYRLEVLSRAEAVSLALRRGLVREIPK